MLFLFLIIFFSLNSQILLCSEHPQVPRLQIERMQTACIMPSDLRKDVEQFVGAMSQIENLPEGAEENKAAFYDLCNLVTVFQEKHLRNIRKAAYFPLPVGVTDYNIAVLAQLRRLAEQLKIEDANIPNDVQYSDQPTPPDEDLGFVQQEPNTESAWVKRPSQDSLTSDDE